MKVVVAVDSFKGSMTSMEAGMAVKAGILAAKKDAEVIVKPLADGGEGTTDTLIEGLKGERVDVTVTGPYHESVQAYYGYLRESNTAVMEMATQHSQFSISWIKLSYACRLYPISTSKINQCCFCWISNFYSIFICRIIT